MPYPKAYEPEQGYKYQILCRSDSREWEHCDYAKDRKEMYYLRGEYRLAFGVGWSFRTIALPRKYWPKGAAA